MTRYRAAVDMRLPGQSVSRDDVLDMDTSTAIARRDVEGMVSRGLLVAVEDEQDQPPEQEPDSAAEERMSTPRGRKRGR
jgi:hypothetical protein